MECHRNGQIRLRRKAWLGMAFLLLGTLLAWAREGAAGSDPVEDLEPPPGGEAAGESLTDAEGDPAASTASDGDADGDSDGDTDTDTDGDGDGAGVGDEETEEAPPAETKRAKLKDPRPIERLEGVKFTKVYVVPIEEQLSKATVYIIGQGVEEAEELGADVILVDMNTPGGRGDYMMDIVDELAEFEGKVITYVNKEAISAGALIGGTTAEIYYHPNGVIGAAAPVFGGGQEIDPSVREKILSYIQARIRSYAQGGDDYRAEVLAAMVDDTIELVIDGEVISPEGRLLTLTALEAMQEYGDPPQPLLGHGIAESIEELLDARYGDGSYEMVEFDLTWSVSLAHTLDVIAPILIGLGVMCLLFELKTPGVGIFGLAGVLLLMVVFIGNFVAGLAGYEPILLFFGGLLLILIELLVVPGVLVLAGLGSLCILASLVWAMATSTTPIGVADLFDGEVLVHAIQRLVMALGITIVGVLAAWKFLPRTGLTRGFLLRTQLAEADEQVAHGASSLGGKASHLPDVGATGVATSDLHPAGEVEIEGKRYQASVNLGSVGRGTAVRVTGYRNFYLEVEEHDS